jgi:hypothetical protein
MTLNKDLLVILPSYQGLERETVVLRDELRDVGCTMLESHGLGLIDRVRSELASRALALPHDRWLWLDADMAAPASEIARLVETAIRHDADALTAIYMTKEIPSAPTCVFDTGSPHWPTPNRSSVVCGRDGYIYPVRRCGFGAIVTHRRMFERLTPTLPEVGMRNVPTGHPFFITATSETGPETPAEYLGEDYSLCERARATGSLIWADSRIRVGHVGRYRYGWEDVVRRPMHQTVELDFG